MDSNEISGYIFSKDDRYLDRWGIPLLIVILFAFSYAFLIPAFGTAHDILPQTISSIFFICVGLFLIWYKRCYSKVVWMTYCFEANVISNQCGQTKHQVFIDSPFFIAVLPIAFSTKGATWEDKYIILSNDPFPKINDIEKGGIQLIKLLNEHKLVIVPENDHITEWFNQTLKITHIPQFPRIAYWK